MTLDEALAAIRAMPNNERAKAIDDLARAVRSSIAGGENWAVFDPLECTSDMAARCWSGRRTMVVGERVCAAVFDSTLPCLHYGSNDM
jgi:hypothetical protein